MARGQGEPPKGGASGDTRNVSSNVRGTKHDNDMREDTSRTGSPGGEQVIQEKTANNKK